MRTLRIIALLFLAWLAFVAIIDLRLWQWWRYDLSAQGLIQLFQDGQWHPENFLEHLKALAFWLLLAASCQTIGRLATRAWLPELAWPMTLLSGMTLMGLMVFMLGIAGLWQPAIAALLLVLPAGAGFLAMIRRRREVASAIRRNVSALTPVDWLMLLLMGVSLLLIVLYALAPPVQSDGLRYHLATPDRWRQMGRIIYLPGFAHSNMPFLVEMNFALALMLKIPQAAHLVHLTYLLAAAGLAALITRQLRSMDPPHRSAELAAALLIVSHPVAAPLAAWPYVDVASLAYLLGMGWALAEWMRRRTPAMLAFAAFMAGGAFACKYTNLLPVAFGCLVVLLVKWRQSPVSAIRQAILFGTIATLVVSPWLVRNAITTGNPVYPLAWSLFGGGDWSSENAVFYSGKAAEKGSATALLQEKSREAQLPGRSVQSPTQYEWFRAQNESMPDKLQRLIALPWNTYRWPGAFEGFPQGPLLILALPLAIVLLLIFLSRRERDDWLYPLFALFLFVSWAATYQSNRFLLPVIAILAIYLALWASKKWPLRIASVIALAFVVLSQVSWTTQFFLAREPYAALRFTFGMESRDAYLSRNVNYYPAAQWLNRNVESGNGVFLGGEHRTFYFEVPVLASDWFDTPAALRLIREAGAADPLDALLAQGISHVYLNAHELLAGAHAMAVETTLRDMPDAGQRRQILNGVLESGVQAVAPVQLPPLGEGSSNYDYFRRRFTDAEWSKWLLMMSSLRLEPVFETSPLSIIYRIGSPEPSASE